MRVRRETRFGCYMVLVEHAEAAVIVVARVKIACKGECVVRVEPAVIGVTALRGRVNDDLCVREKGCHDFFYGRRHVLV